MSATTSNYLVDANAGLNEKHRLALQNQIFGPATEKFLIPLIQPGTNILVLGCGTGEEICFIAKRAGPTAKVTAIDFNEKQLEQAKIKPDENHITNVTLHHTNLLDIDTLPTSFDLIYCRMVLVHIVDIATALNKIYHKLKPSGRLACEEMILSACGVTPANMAFDHYVKLFMQYGETIGVDYDLGARLKDLFIDIGLTDVYEQISQPIMKSAEQKRIILLALAASSSAYLAKNLVTQSKLTTLIEQLETEVVNNPDCEVTQIEVHQVTGVKAK